jgi:endonuclease YncB( thermonuclease family)
VFAIMLVHLAAREAPSQQHAPKGGTYVNGQFYKGGQFLPKGSGGGAGGMFPMDFSEMGLYDVPEPRLSPPKPKAVRPRVDVSKESLARTKLKMARSLLSVGKRPQAINYLRETIETAPGSEPASEAEDLLGRLESGGAPPADWAEGGEVVSVTSGSTIVVADGLRKKTVGLLGVDCTLLGDEPRAALKDLVLGHKVSLFADRGLYQVYRRDDDLWVNREILRTGHARVQLGMTFDALDEFKRVEAEAKAAKRGTWGRPQRSSGKP